jgi:hypothetical protein
MTLLHPDPGGDSLLDFTLLESVPGERLRFRIARTGSAEELSVWTATGVVERSPLR